MFSYSVEAAWRGVRVSTACRMYAFARGTITSISDVPQPRVGLPPAASRSRYCNWTRICRKVSFFRTILNRAAAPRSAASVHG
eukprot:5563339-Prymnesium_polylepis.2